MPAENIAARAEVFFLPTDVLPVPCVKFDLRRRAVVAEADEAIGSRNRLFRALPAAVSPGVGAALYPHCA